jgi:bla regulator protein blaR1
LATWIAVMLSAAAWQVWRYRAFVRRLGPGAVSDGVATASNALEGPLLLGILRPTIVLPADFHQRYTAGERELVLDHERVHAQRRDPLANALFALAQCLWWFNPLVHLAAGRFRLDQEFACDYAVMQRHRGSAHVYAEAMLKTQLSHQRTAFACQWQSHHPLKERILNLNRTNFGTARRLAGRLTIGLMLAAGGISAWAAQSAAVDAPLYSVAMRVHVNGSNAEPRIETRAGEEAALSFGPDDKRVTLKLKVTPYGTETVYLHSILSVNGEVMSRPAMLLKKSQPGSIAVAKDGVDLRMEFTVSEAKPAS